MKSKLTSIATEVVSLADFLSSEFEAFVFSIFSFNLQASTSILRVYHIQKQKIIINLLVNLNIGSKHYRSRIIISSKIITYNMI
jgi:hypothetical protein